MIAVALVLAGAIAAIAWRAHALTADGAAAAALVGILVFSSGGWAFAAVLFAFFIPSVALSRLGRSRKRQIVTTAKSGARDGRQVLANGGVAAIAALIAPRSPVFAAAFAGAFAAAASDTWATEIGTLARSAPRSILTLRTLPAGLSGGITVPGTVAQLAGAAFVGAVAGVTHVSGMLPVAIGGACGSLLDSLLGASLQEVRRCPSCRTLCETQRHACGTATVRARGISWFGNDAVNFACTLAGAVVAGALVAR